MILVCCIFAMCSINFGNFNCPNQCGQLNYDYTVRIHFGLWQKHTQLSNHVVVVNQSSVRINITMRFSVGDQFEQSALGMATLLRPQLSVNWIELNWIELNCHWIELNCHWIELNCHWIELNWIVIELNWIVIIWVNVGVRVTRMMGLLSWL